MKQVAIISYLILFNYSIGLAQQLPLFTQHQAFQGIINPAALSSDYLLNESQGSFSLSARNQWTALEGAPKTNLLQGNHLLLSQKSSLLIGGYILQDKIGPTSVTGVYARLAGILPRSREAVPRV